MTEVSPTPIDPLAAVPEPERRPLALLMTIAMVIVAAVLCGLLLVLHWPL
jgi:hypothetical protein